MTNGKFTINTEQRRDLLQSFNELRTAMTNIWECQDMWMSDIKNLERLMHRMQWHLDFAQRKDGTPYMNYVLAEDNKPTPNKVTRRNKSKEAAR